MAVLPMRFATKANSVADASGIFAILSAAVALVRLV